MDTAVSGGVKKSSIRAVVLNADGTVKSDFGIVSYYHRNPIIRWVGSKVCTWVSGRKIRRHNQLAKEHNNVLSSDDSGGRTA